MKKDSSLIQFLKFILFGSLGGVIQIITVNVFHFAMKGWTTPLPHLLGKVFSEGVMGVGNSCWGYIIPFFLSNLVSQIFQYVQNKRRTFDSDAPRWVFWVYIAVTVLLIFIVTWVQGVVNNALLRTEAALVVRLAPTLSVVIAGQIYTLVLFPMEKFILFRRKARPSEKLVREA